MRQSQADSQLPADVSNYGVTVQKSTSAPLIMFALYSPNGTYDDIFLANYSYININDQMTRVKGIASVTIFGAGQYAMRFWVKPDHLAKLNITIPEIIKAIQAQNNVNPAGQIGGEPVPKGQEFTYAVRAQGRLQSEEEFGNIVLRAQPDGSLVRVSDVARIELGAQTYNLKDRLNGKPAALIALYQLPDSNAIEAADGAKKLMERLKESFPADMDYVVALDTTLAVTEGMKEIVHTLMGSVHSGYHRRFYLPPRLACNSYPVARGAGFTGRNICTVPSVWFFYQHALAFRPRAGDRAGGGRRHRGGRGC